MMITFALMGLHVLWNTKMMVFLDLPPAIAEGRLYVVNSGEQVTQDGKPISPDQIVAGVTAMSSSTGRVLWKRQFGLVDISQPVFAGNSVLVGVQRSENSVIICFDGASGTTKWSRVLTGKVQPIGLAADGRLLIYKRSSDRSIAVGTVGVDDGKPVWGPFESGAVDGRYGPDVCIVGDLVVMPGSETTIQAVDLRTGKPRWFAPVWTETSNSSSVKTLTAKDHAVAAGEGSEIALLSVADGKPIWRHTALQDIQALALTSIGDVIGIEVGASIDKRGSLCCYRASDGSPRWSLSDTFSNVFVGRDDVWLTLHHLEKPLHELRHLSLTTGKVLGRTTFDGDPMGVAEHDGHVFVTTLGEGVYCFSND